MEEENEVRNTAIIKSLEYIQISSLLLLVHPSLEGESYVIIVGKRDEDNGNIDYILINKEDNLIVMSENDIIKDDFNGNFYITRIKGERCFKEIDDINNYYDDLIENSVFDFYLNYIMDNENISKIDVINTLKRYDIPTS